MGQPKDRPPRPPEILSPDGRSVWTSGAWHETRSLQPKPRPRLWARVALAMVPGLVVILLTASSGAPSFLYLEHAYPGAVNAVSAPCDVISPQLADRLVPGARPIKVGLGCGWYARGKSWRGGDEAEIGFDPTVWGPGALPWQTPDSMAHDQYRRMVSFSDWRPVRDVGDEASISAPTAMFVRSGNVTWMLTAGSNITQSTLLAAAHAIARNLAMRVG